MEFATLLATISADLEDTRSPDRAFDIAVERLINLSFHFALALDISRFL